jgi:hypothetical protein
MHVTTRVKLVDGQCSAVMLAASHFCPQRNKSWAVRESASGCNRSGVGASQEGVLALPKGDALLLHAQCQPMMPSTTFVLWPRTRC